MFGYPLGLDFPGKPRQHFTIYDVCDDSDNSRTAFYLYTNGRISMVGGAVCFRITREQLNYALRQARDNGYTVSRKRWLDENTRVLTTHKTDRKPLHA